VTSIRGPDGTLRGFVEAERDLTTRRHAEDALREAEQRYRLLVQNVKDYAILVLDPTGHVMSWNEGAQRLTGYLADEVLGRHFGLFFTPHDRDRHHPEEELETARREGHYEEEAWRVRKDGALFWANVVVTPLLDDAHRLLGFAKVTRDLTERKRAEADLQRRAESFAALNRELDAFSHTVAHDLRAPIRAVEHLSSVLLEEEAERLSAEGRESLGALHASALRMARLVDDLLELSLANAREPRRARVDVTRMASDVAKEISSSEAKRDVDVRVEPGLEAEADPQLLRVAFTNLLSNAIKYTRDVPHAVIEVGRAATPRGSAFFVRDNGVGFDPERAQRLFEPFTRLDTASRYEGTGIGLATVRRIVRRHLGDVWAEAAPGKGATFFFTLAQPAGPSP
jgi:PAS domain S-box-containing protein